MAQIAIVGGGIPRLFGSDNRSFAGLESLGPILRWTGKRIGAAMNRAMDVGRPLQGGPEAPRRLALNQMASPHLRYTGLTSHAGRWLWFGQWEGPCETGTALPLPEAVKAIRDRYNAMTGGEEA